MADEQGAPASFGGRVIPNPDNVEPSWDTDARKKTDEPTAGAHFSIDNPPAADLGQHPLEQFHTKTAGKVQPGAHMKKSSIKISEN